jgi:hypothetical protein
LVTRELPFKVPPIHVDTLWHQRLDADAPHAWLRDKIEVLGRTLFKL